MRHLLTTVAASVGALAALASTPALAQDEYRTRTVSYADLDLGSPADRAIFDRRLNAAIRYVCDFGENRDLSVALAERRCVGDTWTRTRASVEVLVAREKDTQLAQVSTGSVTVAR